MIYVAEDMTSKKGYRFLEHTADVYIEAYGENLAEAFENAARAMFDVMTDADKVNPEIRDEVEVEAGDKHALLYSWLEALLVKFELNEMFYSKFKIEDLSQTQNGFRLKAQIWGEKFNPERHTQKVGVKAITYHMMEIIEKPEKVILKFILDI